MKNCPNCLAANDDSSMICTSCGNPIQSAQNSANMGNSQYDNTSYQSTYQPNENPGAYHVPPRYCPQCNNILTPDATFCSVCGKRLFDNPNPNPNQFAGNGYTGGPQYNPYYTPQKSKVAAGILGIMLGALGIHNFYLGFTGKAITQLLLTVLSCGFLAIVSSVWGLVEGIIILTTDDYRDASGQLLK